jgi:hypothetical protein
VLSNHDILQHAHFVKETDILKRPANTEFCNLMGLQVTDDTVPEFDFAFSDWKNACQQIKKGRLSGSIRPYYALYLT